MKKIILGIILTTILFSFNFEGKVSAASHTGQNVTAYTALEGSKTYHQTTPIYYNTAAVRPIVCGSPTSGTKLAKGTIITTSTSLSFPDARLRNTFSVYDMGDVNCTRNVTPYFFDIYFGKKGTSDDTHAINFGKKTVNYTTR